MGDRLTSMLVAITAAAVSAAISVLATRASAQASASSNMAPPPGSKIVGSELGQQVADGSGRALS